MSSIGNVLQHYSAPAVSNRTHNAGGSTDQSEQTFNPFDFSDSRNAIFQNLLKDPNVQESTTLNEDSTYSFNNSVNGLTSKQGLARLLIWEQNGSVPKDPGALYYTPSQLGVFREMTGINLLQAGGMTTFTDDDGNLITDPGKLAIAREAETALSIAAFRKGEAGDPSNIDISEVIDIILERRSDSRVGTELLDEILSGIGKKADNS